MLAEELTRLRTEGGLSQEMQLAVVLPDGEGGLMVMFFWTVEDIRDWLRQKAVGKVH